jgi:4a-hydroxytetrahydrobiopterin dehydratase
VTELQELEIESTGEGAKPLSEAEAGDLHSEIPAWQTVEREGIERLERVFEFPDFERALAFTNRVGELAEAANHHPMLLTEWGKVRVTWWTHDVEGLHRNDFVMAARTDAAYRSS